MNVVTAAAAAKGETKMITTAEKTEAAQATATGDQAKATKKANAAPAKGRSGKKANLAKKAPRDDRQEDGPDGRIRQGRGRRAHRFRESLEPASRRRVRVRRRFSLVHQCFSHVASSGSSDDWARVEEVWVF
jgi:hypothetical protein